MHVEQGGSIFLPNVYAQFDWRHSNHFVNQVPMSKPAWLCLNGIELYTGKKESSVSLLSVVCDEVVCEARIAQ